MTEIIFPLSAALSIACFYGAGYLAGLSTAREARKQAYRWYMANEKTLAELAECRANSNAKFGNRDERGRFKKKGKNDD